MHDGISSASNLSKSQLALVSLYFSALLKEATAVISSVGQWLGRAGLIPIAQFLSGYESREHIVYVQGTKKVHKTRRRLTTAPRNEWCGA